MKMDETEGAPAHLERKAVLAICILNQQVYAWHA